MQEKNKDDITGTKKSEKVHFPTTPDVYAKENVGNEKPMPQNVHPIRNTGSGNVSGEKTSNSKTEDDTLEDSNVEANVGGR